ncbi:disease resistance protein RFL1-like [Rhododendron vialii]|uniref:disease resistance protein RFL1-like n=1 Tax=Rhododendron vialii TaxID=182163 RepID=UPI00265F54C9|nr:disease resistance protein RFL1-like isoform X1 [Rhododendron vialii]XP_058211533.1 disease resistance protein RFL1-like [Rhododendron vialii]
MCTPQGIIEKLGCLAFDEAVKAAIKAGKYVIHYKTNLENLQAEMGSLKDRSEIIEENVCVANQRGEEVYNAVLHWRTEVNRMTRDVQELVGQSSGTGNMSCLACSCPNIKRRYRLSKQAEEKIAGVQKLTQDSHFDEISHARPSPSELEFPSNKNYINLDSRAPVFKDIVDALKDPSVNVIGVHGLGGVGKTTLVEEVGKKMRHDGTFKQVPLAVVSKDLNVKEIQSKLADRLDIELDATSAEKGRATKLWNKFINGEKYLVILDDIWEEVDIKAIGIPLVNGSTTGCKVLLTSRNENLLTRMKVDRSFPIAELPMPEAWTLFKKLTGNSIDESRPEIYYLACEVCKKCKGLPVAINALGAALKGKPDHAWKNALDNLERHMITNIEGINPSVLASLKLSYDMLWSSDAKSCFLLCCLYPKDVETSIDDLARHCLTRCLLSQNPRTLEEARDAVRTLVGSLKSASLLLNDNDENVVRIHDVIRDVGISIARKEEAFLIDHGAVRWPRNPINGPRYSAISLRAEKIKGLPNELTCPQLHTLMFINSKFSYLKVPDNFFSGMKQLTVLILCRMSLQKLPSSLAKLSSLGMLCLEHCQLEA